MTGCNDTDSLKQVFGVAFSQFFVSVIPSNRSFWNSKFGNKYLNQKFIQLQCIFARKVLIFNNFYIFMRLYIENTSIFHVLTK